MSEKVQQTNAAQDLRDLAQQLAELARNHRAFSQAHRIVDNCCDHLCAVARVNELTK